MPAPKDKTSIKYIEYVEKQRQNSIRQFSDPKQRELASKIAIERLKNPIEREKMSKRMIGQRMGEKNPMFNRTREKSSNYKGGRLKDNAGYIIILIDRPYINNRKRRYVYEHRLIAEQYLNRALSKIEVVHHINGIKDDNRPENLYVFETTNKHSEYHLNPYLLVSNLIANATLQVI